MAKPAIGKGSDYSAGTAKSTSPAPQPTKGGAYRPTMNSLRKSGRPR